MHDYITEKLKPYFSQALNKNKMNREAMPSLGDLTECFSVFLRFGPLAFGPSSFQLKRLHLSPYMHIQIKDKCSLDNCLPVKCCVRIIWLLVAHVHMQGTDQCLQVKCLTGQVLMIKCCIRPFSNWYGLCYAQEHPPTSAWDLLLQTVPVTSASPRSRCMYVCRVSHAGELMSRWNSIANCHFRWNV